MKTIITVIREVTYSSIVEMDEAKFESLSKDLDGDNRTLRRIAEKELNKLIDTRDWQDDDLKSVEEFKRDDET